MDNPDIGADRQLIIEVLAPVVEAIGQMIQEQKDRIDQMDVDVKAITEKFGLFVDALKGTAQSFHRSTLADKIGSQFSSNEDFGKLSGFYNDTFGKSYSDTLLDELMDGAGNISDPDAFLNDRFSSDRKKYGKYIGIQDDDDAEDAFEGGVDKAGKDKETGEVKVKLATDKPAPKPRFPEKSDKIKPSTDKTEIGTKESLATNKAAPKPGFGGVKDKFEGGTDSAGNSPSKVRGDKPVSGGASGIPQPAIDASGQEVGNDEGLPQLPKGRSMDKVIRELGLPMKTRK